jgi:nitroreductase
MFISIAQKRRSIRKFKKKEIEPEKMDVIIEAALRSPSSMGNNPWEFILVTEPEKIVPLSTAKQHGSTFLKNAPYALIVCADPAKSTVWVEDCSIASIFIQLAAESLGLGSCWIQIRDRFNKDGRPAQEVISEILDIPKNMVVESIIALGYPDEQKFPHKKEDLQFEKVHLNTYGKKYGG